MKQHLTMLFMNKKKDHATYHLTCSHDQTIVTLLAVVLCEFKSRGAVGGKTGKTQVLPWFLQNRTRRWQRAAMFSVVSPSWNYQRFLTESLVLRVWFGTFFGDLSQKNSEIKPPLIDLSFGSKSVVMHKILHSNYIFTLFLFSWKA